MQTLRDNKAVSMVAPNSNFITDQVVTLTSLDTKMTKCFPQLVSKQYRHKYITCRLCKGTVAGKVGFHYKQIRASDILRKKKQNFAGFSGANSRKNRPISRDFRGKKVKIRRKIGPFRGILAEKSQFSKDFQGQILRKIGRFHGKFRGETSPRNNQ